MKVKIDNLCKVQNQGQRKITPYFLFLQRRLSASCLKLHNYTEDIEESRSEFQVSATARVIS